MEFALSLISGICWIIVYIELIRTGFKDKTYGMPLIPLALNLFWEVIYSYTSLTNNPTSLQGWVILAWFLLDIAVAFTYFKFGRMQFSLNRKFFLPWTIIIFLMALALHFSFLIEFGDPLASWYSAFIQNLIMSVAFIYMLNARKNIKGQNLSIAVNKYIGTMAATIVFGILHANLLVLVLGIFCAIFDMIYIFYLNKMISKSLFFLKSRSIQGRN